MCQRGSQHLNRGCAVNKCTCSIPEINEKVSAELMEVGHCLHRFLGAFPCPGAPLSCRGLGMSTSEACRASFGGSTHSATSRELLQGATSQMGLIFLLLLWVPFVGCSSGGFLLSHRREQGVNPPAPSSACLCSGWGLCHQHQAQEVSRSGML